MTYETIKKISVTSVDNNNNTTLLLLHCANVRQIRRKMPRSSDGGTFRGILPKQFFQKNSFLGHTLSYCAVISLKTVPLLDIEYIH